MSRYTVRVELHDADEEDYQTLHEAMEELGFTRTIKGHDGNTYRLPSAEYDFEGDIGIETVLDKAKYAAETTTRKCEILVSEALKRKWHGLGKA